jgi:thiol-disulfide isomerase/thioredoxin
MKPYLLIIIISFFHLNISFSLSKSHFAIEGETDIVKDGKAVLIKNDVRDTTNVTNHKFKFEGLLKYPEPCRIVLISSESNTITEEFFIDIGFQRIIIDSSIQVHDFLEVGVGVATKGSKTNDEYFDNYLSLFGNIYKAMDKYYSERSACNSIKNDEKKKACIINCELEKNKFRKSRDSILLNYATLHSQSKIIPWLIKDALFYYGYNNFYKQTFDRVKNYIPENMKKYLDSVLTQNKLKTIGSVFPLVKYINSHFSKSYLRGNKYTLVDFWFTACRPCIGQFNLLKDVYEKNKEKGFDIVAISIDKKSNILGYEKLLKEKNYLWKQILDTGGVKTKFMGISKYPSNFLLDNSDKIIAVDINPFVLEDFLKKNL